MAHHARITLATAVMSAGFCLGILATASHAESNYESQIVGSINDLQSAKLESSLDSLEEIVQKYPNSKLGHLLMADILAARAGTPGIVNRYADDANQLNGLRDEARYRWRSETEQTPAEQGMLPANLLASAPTERYVLAADAAESRLYVFENLGTNYQLVADYFMTIGKQGMGKNKEGDLRTPEGVYFVTSYLPGKGLPARYGPGAFPINYPNEYDRKLKRTGYGIWIHGTEPENYNRVPLASDGCLSLSNDEFLDIQQYISTDWTTPVIISSAIEWIAPGSRAQTLSPAKQVIEQWKADWESLDTERFIAHYSRKEFKNFKAFAKRKRQVNTRKKFIEIDLNNVSIYEYPGDEKMMLVSFDQEYRSDNHHSVTQKKQYWKKQQGRWQIIFES